jgi:hypothetical protein
MPFGFYDPAELKSPEALAMRQKLALAMMAREGKFPTTVGAGLTDVGRAIGEQRTLGRLDQQMAALERASAARGAGAAAQPAPVPATPGTTDPASGARSAAPATTDTAEVAPDAAPAVPWIQTAAAADAAYQPADALPPVQAAGGAPQTVSLDSSTMNDAPPVGAPTGQPDPSAVRNSLASLMQTQRGGLQPNPMLAGSAPAGMPSTLDLDPALLGSPDRSADNRPIELPGVQLAQAGPQPYQRGTLREVPIGTIKPSGAPSEPVSAAPMEPRPNAMEFRKPTFEAPPRMADPGARETELMRAANDPMVLPSFQKQYATEAALLAEKRKNDYDQQIKAFTTRNKLLEEEQARRANPDVLEYERQKLADERAKRAYEERITKHLGGRSPAIIEENLYKSRASVANIPAITQSLARTKAVVDKMYTGPWADAEAFLSQALPQTPFGFDPARGTATQQFKTAMTDIMAAHRAAVVGPGSQSGPELKLLQQSTAADAKLNKDTIKEALDAAERLMVKTAIAHQQEVHNYAGNFDADRTRSVFGSFGVPGMIDVVPQRTINTLMQHSGNEQALKDFDETYHTPGLAQKLIERELLRQQRTRR